MIVLDWLLGLAALFLLVPVGVLCVQVLLACLPGGAREDAQGAAPRVAVLIPAHNEAAVIGDTLRTLLPQLKAGDRVLVVADNCSDNTADLARAAGAEVVERTDADRRGKGYALDFGVRTLEASLPEVLVIVDADCQVEAGALDRLAAAAWRNKRPVQALYLMHNPSGAGLKMRVAEFAWLVKNWVRPLGFHRLGLPCQLMGTGMAFPWAMAASMPLANANIVEDMKLGIELALQGTPPLFLPEARVTSEFPSSDTVAKGQRTRWEHGHLSMILSEAPRLIGRALVAGDLRALGLALDLVVPPLALLALLLVSMLGVSALAMLPGVSIMPLCLSATAVLVFALSVAVAWAGWGRSVLSFSDLVAVPFYVLGKIPLYLKFWTRRQKEWVRTDRK